MTDIFKLRIVTTRNGQNFRFYTELSFRKMSKGIIPHLAFQKKFLTSKIMKRNTVLKEWEINLQKKA